MLTTRKLRIPVLRYSLIIATTLTTLTGCDYFSDNWEIEDGKCQALSSEGNEIAIVSEGSVGFLKMDKGCPDNLDILGSRFTDIEINGEPYKATLLCNDATANRRFTMLGTSENSASGLSARAMKEFTGFMGAKVTIEGESSRFYKGNFTKVCQKYLPRQTASTHSPTSDSSSLTLGDLLNGGRKDETKPASEPDPQAQMMAQAGYEKIDGEWRKKSRQATIEVTEQDRQAAAALEKNGGRSVTDLSNMPGSHNDNVSGELSQQKQNNGLAQPSMENIIRETDNAIHTPGTAVADCTLTNGKQLSVLAQTVAPYSYNLMKKDGTQELELREGLFGVKAFHYYRELNRGKGELKYLRFNKGAFDYVVVQRTDGETAEFDGVVVFKNGDKLATLACKAPFDNMFAVEELPENSHQDSEDMADFILDNTRME
ncbi:hypothetical protein ACMWNV_14840 [Escherichia coli]|uniref:hypothetical protein n=1 Tax=Enterobacteriaceae TaxID=543 RepID=UPI00345B7EF1